MDAALPHMRREAPLIVGREREQARLREALIRARAGHGALVLLSGEAGIGKTTLVSELIREAAAQSCLVLTGACYDLTTTPPYGPWVEALRGYASSQHEQSLPAWFGNPEELERIGSQAALLEDARRFFVALAERQPLVIVLEDLHWADSASLDLLRYLARTLPPHPVLLLATYRTDELAREHPLTLLHPTLVREAEPRRVELSRLAQDAVQELAGERYRLSDTDEARLLAYLEQHAEGNPFFATELLHTLEAQRLLQPVAGGWRLGDLTEAGVPALIQQVIDGRLARLDGATRELLERAALVGYEAPLSLLRQLLTTPPAELDAALQQAQRYHMLELRPDQLAVRFSHALVRQAIYNAIPPLRRATLHAQVGELLATQPRVEAAVVARHFFEAGDARGLDWLTQSAEHAQRLFAQEAVIAECGRAFKLADRLGAEAPLSMYRLRGRARESIGDFDGALADLEQAAALARQRGDGQAEWQALLDLGALWASRDYARTHDYCQQAVELARRMDNPEALGNSLNLLGNWYANADQPLDAFRLHEEALGIFEALNDPRGLAGTHDFLGMCCYLAGDGAATLHHYGRAIPLLRRLDDRQTLSTALATAASVPVFDWAAHVTSYQRAPGSLGSGSSELFDEAVRLARSIDWRAGEAFATSLFGMSVFTHGELRAGLQLFSEARGIADSIQHHQWALITHQHVGVAYTYLLDFARARVHFQRALDIATAMASLHQTVGATGWLASVWVRSGDYEQAERLLATVPAREQAPQTVVARFCWFAAAELLLAQGRSAAALECVDQLIASLPAGQGEISPNLTLLRAEILFRCGALDEAKTQLRHAQAVATAFELPHALWRIHAARRRLYVTQGRLTEAHAAGEQGLGIISNLAAQLDDEELRATFVGNAQAEIPASLPFAPDRAARVTHAGLTPRELDVLRLVADGLTDAEVGERLFISARTVSHHLRSIYAKLDVANRTAAVQSAQIHGLL